LVKSLCGVHHHFYSCCLTEISTLWQFPNHLLRH
jgi:hypothetical protein